MLTEELILSKNPCFNDIFSIRTLKINSQNISDISIISKIKELQYLSLSSNNISSLNPLSNCENLRELNLCNNKISSFEELYFLKNLKKLTTLYLNGNPICDDNNYFDKVRKILPNLNYLDNIELYRNNRNIKNKYMKRIFTEEKKVSNEHSENKNNINNSNLTQYSDKKKILLKGIFSNFDKSDENTVIFDSKNNSRNRNNIIKNLKFINYNDKGKSERKKEINFKNLKMKFRKNQRIMYNNILINNYFQKCPKISNSRKQTVDVNLNNQNLKIKKNVINSNNTSRNTLLHQNSLEIKTFETNKANSLFEGKNILSKKVKKNIKYININKNHETNINETNNYVTSVSLLVNKMNMQDLILLKKIINKKLEILTK